MSADSNLSNIFIVSTTPYMQTTTISVIQAYWNNITALILPPICWCITICLVSFLIFCYRRFPHLLLVKKGGLSTPMLILLINHLVNNSVFLFSQYIINNLVYMKPEVINASGWLNTWWSFWVGNYLMAGPCTIFFVVMDRFLALKMNFKYTPLVQKEIKDSADSMCSPIGTEDNPIANRPCLPLFNKIINYTQQTIKVFFGSMNLIVSSLFFYHLMKAKIANVRDGIVKITILCEIIFDVIPAILSIFFSGAQIVINLNVYLFLMSSLDAALCTIAYTKILFNFNFLKSRPQVITTKVSSRFTATDVQLSSMRAKSIP